MCGIYGFIGHSNNRYKTLKLFEMLGIESEIRGIHATGYYALNNEVLYSKAPLKASRFFKTEDFARLYNEDCPNILVGHNRWATHGDPQDNKNNHPFVTNRFGFVHNGVVGNVDISNEITQRTDCDSEKIFRYFLKRFYNDHNHYISIEKTMKIFNEKYGSFACALVDSKTRELFLFRDDGRPMNWIFIESLNIIIFASTKEIIENSLIKCNIDYNEKDIHALRNGQIMRINESMKLKSQFVHFHKPVKIEKIKKFISIPKNIISHGIKCNICKKVFIDEYFARKHVERAHLIFDLEEISEKLTDLKNPSRKIILLEDCVIQTSFLGGYNNEMSKM